MRPGVRPDGAGIEGPRRREGDRAIVGFRYPGEAPDQGRGGSVIRSRAPPKAPNIQGAAITQAEEECESFDKET